MACTGETIVIGVLSSLVATICWALTAALARRFRARSFVGKYVMHGPPPTMATIDITVRIEFDSFWKNLISGALVLRIFAEHGRTRRAPGTEEWRGSLELPGLSGLASGFYQYPDREGGALRLVLLKDSESIIEHGTPYDPKYEPFVRTLKRIHAQKGKDRGKPTPSG